MKVSHFFTFFLSVILLYSCGKEAKEEVTQVQQKPSKRVVVKHSQATPLAKDAAKKVIDWREYEVVNDFLSKYYSISPNEALNNSKELNDYVKSLKDSVKPVFLETAAFSARLNLLHNETLRLYDMSTITAIKADEVNNQVEKIIGAFSSMNAKINTVIQQIKLDKEIDSEKFDKVRDLPNDNLPDKNSSP